MKLTAPALVLVAVAVVTASTTAGYAGAKVTGAMIKNNAVTSADIKNNTLTSADIKDGSVSGADLANGGIGPQELTAQLSRSASTGKAYAFVRRVSIPGGDVVHVLDAQRTSGFQRVYQAVDSSGPITGTWCLVPSRGVDLSRSAIQVSTEYVTSAGTGIDALWVSSNYACKAGEVEIRTVQWLGDDEPSPSDDVAFQVFAP